MGTNPEILVFHKYQYTNYGTTPKMEKIKDEKSLLNKPQFTASSMYRRKTLKTPIFSAFLNLVNSNFSIR